MVVSDGVIPFGVGVHIFIENVCVAVQQHRTVLDVSWQIVGCRQIYLVQ